MPTGQVTGGGTTPICCLDLVEQLERVAAGPVPLVDEREQRHCRAWHTSNSLRVCGSMPLAASSTITAASAAASTR